MMDPRLLSTKELVEEAYRMSLVTLIRICQSADEREARLAAADMGRLLHKMPKIIQDLVSAAEPPRPINLLPQDDNHLKTILGLDNPNDPPELISSKAGGAPAEVPLPIAKRNQKERANNGFKERTTKSR